VDLRDKQGYGVLHAAAGFGYLAILEILYPLCKEKNQPDVFGNTPLAYAAIYGHSNAIAFLLKNGDNPNTQNINGNTPLFEAAAAGEIASVKILIEGKSRVDIANNNNIFPHVIAYNNEHYEVSKYIEEIYNKLKKSDKKQDNQDNGLIKTVSWLKLHLGEKTEYVITKQTIAGEYDSRTEGRNEYYGTLIKKEKDFFVLTETNLKIIVDGYSRECEKSAESISWHDYRTHGVFIEKSIKFYK
jgi:hypothetical protein